MTRSIYVVQSEPGPVKVGIAKKPRNRLGELRTASAVPLSLAFIGEYDDDLAVAAIEKRAHEILQHARRVGEWFSSSAEEAIAAVLKAAEECGYALRPLPLPYGRRRAWGGGRPAVHATPILVRLRPEQVKILDEWRKPAGIGRPEAIRRLLELALIADQAKKGR